MCLCADATRGEAADIPRSLINRTVLNPDETGRALRINLHRDRAGILGLAKNDEPRDGKLEMDVQDDLAGILAISGQSKNPAALATGAHKIWGVSP